MAKQKEEEQALRVKLKEQTLKEEARLEKQRVKYIKLFLRKEQALLRIEKAEKQKQFLKQLRLDKQIEKLLKDDGVSLIHTIGSVNPPRDPHPWITKYIFPGGYTPSLSEVTNPIEKAGLIVTDIEVLRLHYAHTLRHWKENCLKNKDKIIQMFDEKFFRMWEFYLAGCEMAFKWGDQVVYQFQLTKNYRSTPVTRDYIYQ